MSRGEAALYEGPFEYVKQVVSPSARRAGRPPETWWHPHRPRPEMPRRASRADAVYRDAHVAKHRLFVWLGAETLPDHQLIVFARDDDYTFGVLHSRVHELWARGLGTQLREVEAGSATRRPHLRDVPGPGGHELSATRSRTRPPARDAANGWRTRPTRTRRRWPAGRSRTSKRAADVADDGARGPRRRVLDAYGLPTDGANDQVLAHLLDLDLRGLGERSFQGRGGCTVTTGTHADAKASSSSPPPCSCLARSRRIPPPRR